MLGMAYIRALEVATFYFMFQLNPVGRWRMCRSAARPLCMICGAEDLVAVCREKIAPKAHQLSADGRFSWEEVECLGACANAPMVQIGKDYYEDLTAEKFAWLLDELAAGRVPTPGPQNGRFASEPAGGLTSLKGEASEKHNGSVALAVALGRHDQAHRRTEVPLVTPWLGEKAKGGRRTRAAQGQADDLKKIRGVGPKLETQLNAMGFFHFDQIAAWTEDESPGSMQNIEGFKGRATRDDWVGQARSSPVAEREKGRTEHHHPPGMIGPDRKGDDR
jgi:NADH-quinone oxidoreductase subunit E